MPTPCQTPSPLAALRTWFAAVLRPRPDDLSRLDDRTLRDIGLTRSEILSVDAEFHGIAAATRRGVIDAVFASGHQFRHL